MGAFHVVGVNFKLRFGIDLRIVRKQKVAVGLLGVRFLRVFMDNDASVENAVSVIVEDSVVKLAAATAGAGVLDQHVIVEMLSPVADEEPIDQAFASFAG